jgi:uncharacterized protein (TIGR02118 family)
MKKGMIVGTVYYPNGEGATFDMEYYCKTHIPLVTKLMGNKLKGSAVENGLSGATSDSPAPYIAVGKLYFESVEAFESAFGPNAEKIMADTPNYTNIEPTMQIGEVMI